MVTRVNSFPKVLHEYFHFLVHLMRTDNDTAILRRVVDGVGKEVREYPGDLLTVYKELGYFFRILHFDMAIEALRLHTVRLDCIIDQFNRLDVYKRQVLRKLFHPGCCLFVTN